MVSTAELPAVDKQPKFGAPTAAPSGPVPRVIRPLERAPKGLTRFKCREDRQDRGSGSTYILAKEQDDAEELFRSRLPKPAEGEAAPRIVICELND